MRSEAPQQTHLRWWSSEDADDDSDADVDDDSDAAAEDDSVADADDDSDAIDVGKVMAPAPGGVDVGRGTGGIRVVERAAGVTFRRTTSDVG